ncbi:MAG: NAD(P)-dependent oxidoreductase [Planctomycetaceae bacterium]
MEVEPALSHRFKAPCGVNSQHARPTLTLTLTADFFDSSGNLKFTDIGLDALNTDSDVDVRRLDVHKAEIASEQLCDAMALVVLTPRVTARSLQNADDLLVVARFGVGYDNVDIEACTARDVVVTITTGAVDRPVAEATLAWMLALTYKVPLKDRLVREARWDEREKFMGQGLSDRTLGIIGFGGIGRELARLTSNFGMRIPLVFDPHLTSADVAAHGGCSVALDELLTQADFVSVHCPLTPGTRGLLGPRELGLMKRTAFLLNTARGGIVDEDALFEALRDQRIGGAAIDCFAEEPLCSPPRFAELNNVLLAPHAIAWTEGLFRDMGRAVLSSILELRRGQRPRGVVNREVFERPRFQDKWRRFCAGDRHAPRAPGQRLSEDSR